MFRDMRKQERKLTTQEAQQILSANQYGILSTVCEDGYPYGVPLSYSYLNGKIYFHGTSAGGLKDENITNCEKACFTVVGDTEVLPGKFSTRYESAIAFGKIHKLEGVEAKTEALTGILEKYSQDFMDAGLKYIQAAMERVAVYEFEIEYVTGKARR